MKSLRRFVPIALIALISSTLSCHAIKSGFYRNEPELNEVYDCVKKADRFISSASVEGLNLSVNFEEKTDAPSDPIHRFVKTLPLAELHELLAKEKNKALIVVLLEKPIMSLGTANIQKAVTNLKTFAVDLGYKRILIIGAHFDGVSVWYDSAEDAGWNRGRCRRKK